VEVVIYLLFSEAQLNVTAQSYKKIIGIAKQFQFSCSNCHTPNDKAVEAVVAVRGAADVDGQVPTPPMCRHPAGCSKTNRRCLQRRAQHPCETMREIIFSVCLNFIQNLNRH